MLLPETSSKFPSSNHDIETLLSTVCRPDGCLFTAGGHTLCRDHTRSTIRECCTHCHTIGYAHGDLYTHRDPHADADIYVNADRNADRHADADDYTVPDEHTDADRHPDVDTERYTHAHPDGNTYRGV